MTLLGPQARAQSVAWDSLAPTERETLAPWQPRWASIAPDQQQRLLRNTRHWLGLDDHARAQLQQRVDAWNRLPPAQRALARERAAVYARLPPDERILLQASHQRVQAMAPVERDALRAAFEKLGPSERRDLLIGESERDLALVAQQAFAFVPPDERPATLAMLRALTAGDRTRLATLARRIGPDQRAQLRRELLGRNREQRSAYLRERLDRT